jgi:hypothetical protein
VLPGRQLTGMVGSNTFSQQQGKLPMPLNVDSFVRIFRNNAGNPPLLLTG